MTAITRRLFVAAAAAAVALPRDLRAQASGPYALPDLPYAPDALEPHIDARTMEIHHGRHHAGYVSNLNAALEGHGALAERPLHEILASLDEAPEDIRRALRNNGGGHANHAMFWEVMGPGGGAPEGELLAAIDRDFGGLEAMRTAVNRAGAGQFGSGWAFVTVDGDGRLAVAARPNQDTPLMEGGRVLMGVDVWEHAYYLNYQNRRGAYLEAWWNVVDWGRAGQRYAAAKAGTLTI